MKSYIDYVLVEEKPKTDVYAIFARSTLAELGIIQWHAPWRQYCFFPVENTIWSKGCLNEVNALLNKFMDEWKARRELAKKSELS